MPVSMNKKVVLVDSDQEMEDAADIPGAVPQNNSDEEEEEEEEFEIEEILEAKPGVFPAVCYLLFYAFATLFNYLTAKTGWHRLLGEVERLWPGAQQLGERRRCWVRDLRVISIFTSTFQLMIRCSNAADLIQAYWKKARKDRRGRKSEPKAKSTPVPKGRKSLAEREESSVDAESAPAKKRGRPPKPAAQSVSDDEVDEVPQSKKAKQVAKRPAESTSARKARAKQVEEEIDEDEDEQFLDIKKLKNLDDWSPFVESIDTIERTADGTLFVYFIL